MGVPTPSTTYPTVSAAWAFYVSLPGSCSARSADGGWGACSSNLCFLRPFLLSVQATRPDLSPAWLGSARALASSPWQLAAP